MSSSNPLSTQYVCLPNALLLGEVKRYIQEGKSVTIRTKGNSMLPFIRGEMDSVELSRRDSYCKGDIVLAEITPGHYVLHRIWAIQDDRIVLMGDGNCRGKEKCQIKDLVAKVDYIITPTERKINPDSFGLRIAARVWRFLLPLRGYLLAIYFRLRKKN